MLKLILLSLVLSFDAIATGISYGIRKIHTGTLSLIILTLTALMLTGLSSFLGKILFVFSPLLASIIGASILIITGIIILMKTDFSKAESLSSDNKKINYPYKLLSDNTIPEYQKNTVDKSCSEKYASPDLKEYSPSKSLNLEALINVTANITKAPEAADFNNSKSIEPLEAFILGIALSLDSVSVAVGISAMGVSPLTFAVTLTLVQLILFAGAILFSSKITIFIKNENIAVSLSAFILILTGLSRIAEVIFRL